MSVLFKRWAAGQQVRSQDMLDIQDRTRTTAQQGACIILGAESFIDINNPLTITPGSGLTVDVGAPGQDFVLQGSYVDYLPTVVLTFAANTSTEPRQDLICAQYAAVPINPFSIPVKSGNTVTLTTEYEQGDGIALIIEPGTPGAGDPTVPAGYVALARVIVQPAATQLYQSNIVLLIETQADLLSGEIGGGVTSLQGLLGALMLVSRDNTLSFDTTNGQIGITAAGLVKSVNGQTGNVTIVLPTVPVTSIAGDTTSPADATPVNVRTSGTSFFLSTDKYPVGASIEVYTRVTTPSDGQPSAIYLPELPTNAEGGETTWLLYGRAMFQIASGALTLTGGGGNSDWNGTTTQPDITGITTIECYGTATSGQQPSLLFSWGSSPHNMANVNNQLVVLRATRTS